MDALVKDLLDKGYNDNQIRRFMDAPFPLNLPETLAAQSEEAARRVPQAYDKSYVPSPQAALESLR